MVIHNGSSYKHTRIFSRLDILSFSELTGDKGNHHTLNNGKVMAHGLLVASIVTKIGGDLNYISKNMNINFLHPVYEDEVITGTITIIKCTESKFKYKIHMHCEISNEKNALVAYGESSGVILKKLF